ncbi:glycosyltransferase [Pseudoxanthomonas sp. SGD-10]|nr:glycosyltransferase [Pseudoxanthomonas sp. SGD-10]
MQEAAIPTNPKLSVITVVYNNVRDIERTILSVIQQTYHNIEYIIIDGASTDGTLNIINNYKEYIHVLVSEPDRGIYDAMNKGINLASGDYLLFMNSGDEIYEPTTVERIFNTSYNADIYYGETIMINDNLEVLGERRHKVPEHFTWKSFKYGMSISHQAIYVKKNLAGFYDTERYQLSADIDWILKIAKRASKIVNTKMYVAKYLVGGMSKKRHLQSLKERYYIFNEYYGYLPNAFNHLIIAIRLIWYRLRYKNTND